MMIILLRQFLLLLLWLLPLTNARDCARSWRRAWRDMDCQEQDDFLQAVSSLKENSDLYDEFVWVHEFFGQWTHSTPEFLPWHRWFVWQFEKALQEHTGRCVYVPYWDSERDAEREWESPVLEQDTFGRWDATSDGCVDEGIVSWDGPFGDSWTMDGGTGCVEREFLDASRFAFSGEAEMLSLIANMDEYDGYREDFEMGPHMLVHGLIGGHMGTNWSPADPLFWLHHSNIDRIWTMWQDYWEHDDIDPDEYFAPWHYEGDRLDDELTFDTDEASWNFQMQYEDGSWGFPTARDVMSNSGPHMQVTYMNDHLAALLEYDANPQLHRVATDDVDIRCDRELWQRHRHLENASREKVLREMPPKNSLQGQVDRDDFLEADINMPSYCRNQRSLFTLEEDREEWKRLCMELPHDTPMAERLALLSQSNCDRRGNPRTDDPELLSRMNMMMTNMHHAASSAYECHHKPKR